MASADFANTMPFPKDSTITSRKKYDINPKKALTKPSAPSVKYKKITPKKALNCSTETVTSVFTAQSKNRRYQTYLPNIKQFNMTETDNLSKSTLSYKQNNPTTKSPEKAGKKYLNKSTVYTSGKTNSEKVSKKFKPKIKASTIIKRPPPYVKTTLSSTTKKNRPSTTINNPSPTSNKRKYNSHHNKTINTNVTVTTTSSNHNGIHYNNNNSSIISLQKSYCDVFNSLNDDTFFGVWISSFEFTKENEVVCYLGNKLKMEMIYVPKNDSNYNYEKTIKKIITNNSNSSSNTTTNTHDICNWHFIIIEQSFDTLQRLNIEHNDINTLIIFKKENTTQKQMYVVSLNGTTDINDIHPILTNITKVIEFNSFKQIDKNIVSKCRELIRNIIDNQSIVNSGICDFIAVWINNVNSSNNIYEQYKNQHLIKDIYDHANKHIQTMQLVVISLNNKDECNYINRGMHLNSSSLCLNDLTDDIINNTNMIIYSNNLDVISVNGISDIMKYEKEVIAYWKNIANMYNNIISNEYLRFNEEDVGMFEFEGKRYNDIKHILNYKDVMCLNLYHPLMNVNYFKELNNIYTVLKYKYLFISYDISQSTTEQNPITFGLISHSKTSITTLIHGMISIDFSTPCLIIYSFLKNTIIKTIHTSKVQCLYPYLNECLSPYNHSFNKEIPFTFLHPQEKLITPKNTRLCISNALDDVSFVLLYFNDINPTYSKTYSKYTSILNELYMNINAVHKRVEIVFVPYDKSVSIKTLQYANKAIQFLLCDYTNINAVYQQFNRSKTFPKLMLLDKYNNVIEDNIINKIETKGESVLYSIITKHLNVKYRLSVSSMHLSFLGDEFTYLNKRISRSELLTQHNNAKYIGVVFVASWCLFVDEFINRVSQYMMKDNNNKMIMIINNIDNDKSNFISFEKMYKEYYGVVFDYRKDLYKRFNVKEMGMPVMMVFDVCYGKFIKYVDNDTLDEVNNDKLG